jgi:hypothetical protein
MTAALIAVACLAGATAPKGSATVSPSALAGRFADRALGCELSTRADSTFTLLCPGRPVVGGTFQEVDSVVVGTPYTTIDPIAKHAAAEAYRRWHRTTHGHDPVLADSWPNAPEGGFLLAHVVVGGRHYLVDDVARDAFCAATRLGKEPLGQAPAGYVFRGRKNVASSGLSREQFCSEQWISAWLRNVLRVAD